MNGTAHALPWPSLALQQKNINRSNMFSGAGEDKRRQSGPGARGAHPTPFFFFLLPFPCSCEQITAAF